jgi:hypothetical protein
MSLAPALPNHSGRRLLPPRHLRPRREKVFGDGRPMPLDRNGKVRVITFTRALMRRTEPGKHYGQITAKAFAVAEALLWGFHNARSGLCFPSYETIADKAGCARSTVAEAIKALEDAGVLTWVNRITRIKELVQDLFGHWVSRWRTIRISNAYSFKDPCPAADRARQCAEASKSELTTGTLIQDSSLLTETPSPHKFDPDNALDRALINLGKQIGAVS